MEGSEDAGEVGKISTDLLPMNLVDDIADEAGSAVDKARIDLDQAGAGCEFAPGIVATENAPGRDDRNFALQVMVESPNQFG